MSNLLDWDEHTSVLVVTNTIGAPHTTPLRMHGWAYFEDRSQACDFDWRSKNPTPRTLIAYVTQRVRDPQNWTRILIHPWGVPYAIAGAKAEFLRGPKEQMAAEAVARALEGR